MDSLLALGRRWRGKTQMLVGGGGVQSEWRNLLEAGYQTWGSERTMASLTESVSQFRWGSDRAPA